MKTHYRVLRVAAYCRVSTKQEEQLNSYENQVQHYTERINSENGWTLEGIYADKGISGTSVKNRDEFNRMIRRCKQGKIDMIITKSIARFARNTVDCLKYVRLLNDLGVDVYFEEQGIHSNQPGAEFYITIYGSIAQSESENISANIKWGKAQSAKEGKVIFQYKNFLGYRKGEDGQPEIVPEEAETIRLIYDRFLAGDSLCVFLCLYLIEDTEISLAAGVGAAVLAFGVIITPIIYGKVKQEKLAGKIARYSENYLRACLNEHFWEKESDEDLLDFSVDTIKLLKVAHTEETTTVTADIFGTKTFLPENQKPFTKKFKKRLIIQRARYPEKRKADGEFYVEKDCPSCGANFMPDENHCCSFCGFGLQVNNAKWIVQKNK